ncbi:MAG: ankyrin repeat domain-containing protein [Chromatiales bacterium]|jgi:ankyrin repeat protein
MNKDIQALLEQVQSTADFGYVSFNSINDTNELGDNALHCVCVWGDLEAAKLLVENGIDINQRGEGGFTPLNIAIDFGHQEIAGYLIANGADTSVIGAKEQFDREKHNLHMKRLTEEIEALEEKIEQECGDSSQPEK